MKGNKTMKAKFRVGQRVMPTPENPYALHYRKGATVTMVSKLDARYIGVNNSLWAAAFWRPLNAAMSKPKPKQPKEPMITMPYRRYLERLAAAVKNGADTRKP